MRCARRNRSSIQDCFQVGLASQGLRAAIGLVFVGVVFFGFDMLVKAVLDPAWAKLTSRFVAAFLAMFVVPLLFGPLHKVFSK